MNWDRLGELYRNEKGEKRVISISNIIIPRGVIRNLEDCMFLPAEITDLRDASDYVRAQVRFRPAWLPELSSKEGWEDKNYTHVCILLGGVDEAPTLERKDFEELKRTSSATWDCQMVGMPITTVCYRDGRFAGFLPRKPYLK